MLKKIVPNVKDELVAVAWLHDVLEDTDTTVDELTKKFGMYIANLVHVLTKKNSEDYFDYIMRVRDNKGAIPIKLADLAFNKKNTQYEIVYEKDKKKKKYYKQRLEKYKFSEFALKN